MRPFPSSPQLMPTIAQFDMDFPFSGLQASHNLFVCFFHSAEIPAETVLVQLLAGCGIPQAAGVRADLIGENNRAVAQSAKLKFEINKFNIEFYKICFQVAYYFRQPESKNNAFGVWWVGNPPYNA